MEYPVQTQNRGQVTATYAQFSRQLTFGTYQIPAEQVYKLVDELANGFRRTVIRSAEQSGIGCIVDPKKQTVKIGDYLMTYDVFKILVTGVITEAFQPNEELTKLKQSLEERLA